MGLHALAFLVWPGKLWGLSHLAAWPPSIGLVWTAAAAALLLLLPRGRGGVPPFPGRRGAVLAALAAAVLFALLRERTHFFGDGYLLIRDRGDSETALHGPLVVAIAKSVVETAARMGVEPETSLAALSIAAGGLAVFLLLRLAAALATDRGGRWTVALLVGTAGSMHLFFGHVEYYALLAAAVLAWLLSVVHAMRGGPAWPTWVLYGVLPSLHFSSLALAPAQLAVGVGAWKAGRRRETLLAACACAGLAGALAVLLGDSSRPGTWTSLAGARRYVQPYFDATSERHAFGLFDAAHFLAFLDDLLLVAPMALAALPAILVAWSRSTEPRRADPPARTLDIAAAGGLVLAFLFNREVGPYRDWDNLASFGFVYLAWVASRLVQPPASAGRATCLLVLVAGLHHLVPWVALQLAPPTVLAHARLVLQEPSQWSPYARGYMHEEMAVWWRGRGDEDASLREYEAAVRANPADARYHLGLGRRYYERGDLERAVREYRIAIAKRPDLDAAHNNLAGALIRLGDLEGARPHVEAALRARPLDPDYLTNLGILEMRLGRLPEARAALETALRSDPQAKTAQRALVRVQELEAAARATAPSRR